ncbi:MAG TPA: hypothetical protein VIN58_15950, partial [Roseateles sp.]
KVGHRQAIYEAKPPQYREMLGRFALESGVLAWASVFRCLGQTRRIEGFPEEAIGSSVEDNTRDPVR